MYANSQIQMAQLVFIVLSKLLKQNIMINSTLQLQSLSLIVVNGISHYQDSKVSLLNSFK